MEISGRAFAVRYYMEPGGLWWTNVLNSALPPQRLRPDTGSGHQDPVSHTAKFTAAWIPKCRMKSFKSEGPTQTPALWWWILDIGIRHASSALLQQMAGRTNVVAVFAPREDGNNFTLFLQNN